MDWTQSSNSRKNEQMYMNLSKLNKTHTLNDIVSSASLPAMGMKKIFYKENFPSNH